jgi:hypothetical protein
VKRCLFYEKEYKALFTGYMGEYLGNRGIYPEALSFPLLLYHSHENGNPSSFVIENS